MAKGANQKLKLLYLTKIFREQTDENHMLTISEITERLSDYAMELLTRHSSALRHFGLDIIS